MTMPRLTHSYWIIGALMLAMIVAAAGFAMRPQPVSAHGVQVASEPAPNAQVAESPKTISVTFSEPVEPSVSTLRLYDQTGVEVPIGEITFPEATVMIAEVPQELPSAIYTVIWRNLSTVDGHTWSGSFPFTMLGPGGSVPQGTVAPSLQALAHAPSQNPSALETAARWVVLLGTAIMLGGTAYVLFVARPAAGTLSTETATSLRKLSRTVLLVTAALGAFFVLDGSVLLLVIQADRLGGVGRVDELLRDTRVGHYLIARQVLLLVALLAMLVVARTRKRASETAALSLLLVASFGVLLTQSLVSHAAASHGSFWTTGIDLFHLLAASLWIGALIHIGLAMPRWLDELKGVPRTVFAAESFRRFSLLAAASVLVLMASGVLSGLAQFTDWNDLWTTNYGWALIGKLGAIVPLLAVAAINAFFLRPRVIEAGLHLAGGADGSGDAMPPAVASLQRALATTVRVEAVLAVVVLIAVAVLIQLQSPRTTAKAQQTVANAPSSQSRIVKNAEVNGLTIVLRVSPGTIGENDFEVGLGSEFGAIGEVQDVRLDFSNPATGEGGSRLPLPLAGSAKYQATGSNLSLPGDWTIDVTIRRRGEDDTRATFEIPLEAAGGASNGATEPPPAATTGSSGSIWDWPFDGVQSAAAIAILAAVVATATGWFVLQMAHRRTRHAEPG